MSGVLRNKSRLSLSLPLQIRSPPAMAAAGALADYQESRRRIAAASGTIDPEGTAGVADMLESLLRVLRLDSGLWQSRNNSLFSAMFSKEVLKQGCLHTDDLET